MSNEREQLIMKLKELQKNMFNVEKVQDAWECMPTLLDYIGDIDCELREELIYYALSEWITEKEYFNEAQLRQILSILIDENHLFYQIGSDGDDSVFTRTFSVLQVVLILYMHRKKAFLSINEFSDLKNKLIEYYTLEKDLRGILPEKGWAHGGAHGADVMDELVQCCESNEDVVQEVLNAFKKVMYNGKYILCEEEDERISVVVFRIIKMKLISNQSMIKWLNELSECIEWEPDRLPEDRMRRVARVNSKNFIRCLYFKVMHYDNTLDIIDEIFRVEEKLNLSILFNKSLIEQ
ncbi:DUF2785 domain-containing protein [Chengkuizengella axinellae]|uniref:DUF2785 domain-containing protein n=1 Tax=Chengkuizengella axinellae TaxID=3064388 RepID=A0ABT9J6H3_9BACL|nr:DUF2785 domain-containing protein [Chengkuizengella sp. 2205SS18-9]MDP5277221.1 DUF2785 domain-containing protein [Chengkuizengella sp. 2205SS18-9]